MSLKKQKKSAFTLVEMLIVIVIIGILAAALIPRFSQARERANDTARKANLQNIAAVLVAYQIDRGTYPTTPGTVASIEEDLLSAGMNSVPTDPDTSRSFQALATAGDSCAATTSGQYQYTPVEVRGVANAGFVLAAGSQTEGGSNRIFDSQEEDNAFIGGCIDNDSELRDITFCDGQFDNSALSASDVNLEDCIYYDAADVLRYIYVQ